MLTTEIAKSATKRVRRMAREPKPDDVPQVPRERLTKSSQVLVMLARPEGATLDQLVATTGWLHHTARAALTGLKKKGHAVTSEKPDGGVRIYRVAAAPEAPR